MLSGATHSAHLTSGASRRLVAGRSVTSADFQPATLNDVAGDLQDADTLSEGEQDELNDLGELGEPGPEAECALSEDE